MALAVSFFLFLFHIPDVNKRYIERRNEMSKKIELGKEYRFAGYDWIAVLCDNSNGVILQSLGITSGPWPGYKMEEYGNSQYYNSDISSINDYDEKTRKLYERIKGVEKKYSAREEGLYFPAGYVAGTNKVWRKALVTLAERAMDYVWLGTVRGKAALYISPCAGADYYLKSYCNQEKSCVIAPAFYLDLSKVSVDDEEILIGGESAAGNMENMEKSRKFGIALKEKPGMDGLTKQDVAELYDMLDGEEAFPLELEPDFVESSAMGFITPEAAEALEYEYQTGLREFVVNILDDMENESEDGTYEYKGIRIHLSR